MIAYTIFVIALLHLIHAWRARSGLAGAIVLAGAVTFQAALGIVTLLHQAPLPLALAHQFTAIIVFTVAIVHAERLWHREGFIAYKPAMAGLQP